MKADEKKQLTKIIAALEAERDNLDGFMTDLQETFDDLSEKAQEGEKGEALQAEIDGVGEAYDELDTLIGNLNSLLEGA